MLNNWCAPALLSFKAKTKLLCRDHERVNQSNRRLNIELKIDFTKKKKRRYNANNYLLKVVKNKKNILSGCCSGKSDTCVTMKMIPSKEKQFLELQRL